jgi:hypothetical protein
LEPVTGIAAVIAAVSAVVTATVTWIGQYMGAIMASGSELLLIMFAIPLVGLGIGALKRLAN